jgi:hypothetical protein
MTTAPSRFPFNSVLAGSVDSIRAIGMPLAVFADAWNGTATVSLPNH